MENLDDQLSQEGKHRKITNGFKVLGILESVYEKGHDVLICFQKYVGELTVGLTNRQVGGHKAAAKRWINENPEVISSQQTVINKKEVRKAS